MVIAELHGLRAAPQYVSPEVLHWWMGLCQEKPRKHVANDMWALGCLLLELLSDDSPFGDDDEEEDEKSSDSGPVRGTQTPRCPLLDCLASLAVPRQKKM